jgi:autotransporter-associated beta strand protein
MKNEKRRGSPLAGLTVAAILLASTAGYVSALSKMFQSPLTFDESASDFLGNDMSDAPAAAQNQPASFQQYLGRTTAAWLINALPSYSSGRAREMWYLSLDSSGDRRAFELPPVTNTRVSGTYEALSTSTFNGLAPTTSAFAHSSSNASAGPSAPNAPLADQTWDGGTTGNGTAWYTTTNWVGDAAFAGSGSVTTNTDIATIPSTGTNPNIGINGATNATLYLGAINFTSASRLIGDSSNTSFTLQLNGATVNSVANVILRNSGTGTLTLAPTQSNAGVMSIALGNATDNIINIDGAGGITITALIKNGPGSKLTFNGNSTGILTIGGTTSNTYTGLTTVNVGEMDLSKTAALNAIAGNLTIGDSVGAANSATVKLINADQIANTSDVTINSDGLLDLNGKNETIDALNGAAGSSITLGIGTLTVGANNENIFTYAGTSSGTGGLTKAGSGILILSGANAYTGDTTIKAGELFLTSSGSLAAASTIRLGDTAINSPSAMFTFGSTSGGVTLTNPLIVQASASGTEGTRTLLGLAENGATNTYAGNITMNTELTVQSAAAGSTVANGPGILLFQGGTIDVKDNTFIVNSNLRGNNADTYSIQGTVVVNEVLGSSLATGGGVLKEGSGTLILQGTNNTYTGTDPGNLNNAAGTRIGLGILAIYGDGSLGLAPTNAANNVYFVAPTTATNGDSIAPTLRADAGGITLAPTRNVNIASGVTGQIDSNGNTFTVAGVINGGGNLAKIGPGTLVLTGNNTYTGTTTVNSGTLLVNGDQSAATGAVTVNNNGTTLGGNGIIGGSVTVNSGANLAPGNSNSTGILTTGAVTLQSGSNFVLELNNTTPGSGYDQLVVNGSVTLNLGNIVVMAGGGLNVGDKFFVVVNDGVDPVVGAFAQGATVTSGSDTFLINYLDDSGGGTAGNDISLTLTAIPEPSTWLGAALALVAIGYTQRRRLRGYRLSVLGS